MEAKGRVIYFALILMAQPLAQSKGETIKGFNLYQMNALRFLDFIFAIYRDTKVAYGKERLVTMIFAED